VSDSPVDAREPVAGAFPDASLAEWEQLVRAKTKNPDAPLRTMLEDGIEVSWLYTAADALVPDPGGLPGVDPFVRGTRIGAPWAIRQARLHGPAVGLRQRRAVGQRASSRPAE
jgi:methylmalonyl-CoA mutase